MSAQEKKSYPDFIKNLPQADLPLPGAVGHLLSGPRAQVVFFEMPAGMRIPPHSHDANGAWWWRESWSSTSGGTTGVRQPGDSYFVPAQVEHSAVILEDALILEVFADPKRYQEKG